VTEAAMGGNSYREDSLILVARPLLTTIMTTLRPDLSPIAVGMAVEQIVLETDVDVDRREEYWSTVRFILSDLLTSDRS
jgi:hypothetical protein